MAQNRASFAALVAAAALALGCAGTRPAATAAARAEEAIDAQQARKDVAWLAAPERTGRGVGTPGNAAAADFIAGRMKALGLVPAGEGGFFQTFDAPVGLEIAAGNALALGGTSPALDLGWRPFTFSDNGRVEGELVWVGYGITAPELTHDDYAGVDVKGKVVLVAAHFPRETDPASPFRAPRALQYGEWRYKALNAREHGAAAILGVRDDWHHPGPDELPKRRGTVSSRAGIPAALVTASALAEAGVDAAGLAAASAGKAQGRALGVPVRLTVQVEQQSAATANVVGLVPGADHAVAGECVVIGAHYDHLGLGGETSLAPEQEGQVHPGADDNASGVAALLGIAKAVTQGDRPRRTMAFVAFSGEELGLLGSSRFVKSPPAACPVEKMQLMVNLDMVGRPQRVIKEPSKRTVYVEGTATARGLAERVHDVAGRRPTLGLDVATGGDGYGPSDHTSFFAQGVPVLFFFTGAHLDYHRPTDTADKVDADGLTRVARLAFRAAADAASSPARLEVVRAPAPPPRRERGEGYGAYLGGIPDFEVRKDPGVRLTGVRPGSPAEKAGLAAGDVLLRLGGTGLQNLQDLAYVLRSHRPGDVVELEYARGSEVHKARVTLEERR